jgi:uncharacterized protein YukE
MNHPEEAPKLPKFPFIAGDLVLIATAVVIATRSATPIGPWPLLAITICVVFGAFLLGIPFLANYARRQDAELTERQHQIAALARTTADSAEQLSIATAGLQGIGESSKQNLDTIGKLPARLQERLDSLTQQLAGSAIASQASIKEDLAQLEAAAEKISRTLAKLDAATKTKSDAIAALEKDLADALTRATSQINAFVATAAAAATLPTPAATAPAAPSAVPVTIPLDEPVVIAPAPVVAEPAPVEPKPKSHKPKHRHGQPAPSPTTAEPDAPKATETPIVEATPAVKEVQPEEPAPTSPAPLATIVDEPAVAPAPEPEPAPEPSATPAPVSTTVAEFAPASPDSGEVPVDEPSAPKQPRARKPQPADDGFDLGLTSEASEAAESSISSDGSTRLIATAYIGIGNKLYIRGDGPGLSWDKGVALQFVSIGKWRWETPDATAPIKAKLYKNDQVECLGLGGLTLEPGRQHEVNAGF